MKIKNVFYSIFFAELNKNVEEIFEKYSVDQKSHHSERPILRLLLINMVKE